MAEQPRQTTQYRRVQNGQSGQRRSGGLTPAQRKERARRKQELLRRKKRRRRNFVGIFILFVILVAFFAIKSMNGSTDSDGNEALDELDLTSTEDDDEAGYNGPAVATIAFVGDISTSADQVKAVTKADGTYDFSTAFADVADYFSAGNVAYAVGSFETNLVDGLSYGTEPYYNSPVQLAGTLRNIGFRLMSTATTYALNNGIQGLTSTKNYLTEAKLKSVGTYLSQEDRDQNGGAYISTIHGIKFAFLAYTKGTDSVTMPQGCEYALNTLYSDYSDYWSSLRSSQIQKDVQAAKDAGADVIIALVHWGSEYSRSVSTPQEEAAELLLENGVDVIIGSHSHLVSQLGFQEVTLADGTQKQCFVAYGLGDFYTDPAQETAQQSLILNLEFTKNDDGNVTISNANYVPIYMYISQVNGTRTFQILDVYKNLAELKRSDMTSEQALLFNELLDTLDTLHNYGGEDLDAGPSDTDKRMVEKALEDGEISASDIKALQQDEAEAAEEAEEAKDEAEDEAAEVTEPTEAAEAE
jgi:poly-gamma-glutamate synthesis protein (capsule biosynthesis protein)